MENFALPNYKYKKLKSIVFSDQDFATIFKKMTKTIKKYPQNN